VNLKQDSTLEHKRERKT